MSQTENRSDAQGDIVATAGSYYRNTRYIIAAACLVMGLWFGYDGFIGYPESNRKLAVIEADLEIAREKQDVPQLDKLTAERKDLKHHTDTDIRLQRTLFYILPPLAVFLLIRWIHASRGEYRLSGDTLYAPGHPPVSLSGIRDLDKTLWDRKGIAFATYEEQGRTGKIRLDDFVYQRPPIHAIVERIEQALGAPPPADAAPAEESEPSQV